MNAHDYEGPIRDFIDSRFLEGQGSDLTVDSPLLALGLIDSFSLVELVVFCESRFGVRIPDRELTPRNLDTVAHIAALLQRLDSESGVVQLG
jgi:acyl carrier protein